jgi:hypothetical protein
MIAKDSKNDRYPDRWQEEANPAFFIEKNQPELIQLSSVSSSSQIKFSLTWDMDGGVKCVGFLENYFLKHILSHFITVYLIASRNGVRFLRFSTCTFPELRYNSKYGRYRCCFFREHPPRLGFSDQCHSARI